MLQNMQKFIRFLLRFLVALAVVAVSLPQGASAQVPSQTLPPYAQPTTEQTIHGRISAINGTFNISVRDDSGYVDSVELHRGTIINPTGLTLAVGMQVTILGYSAGAIFEANEIDTPYTYAGPPPPPFYYGPGWWYPGYVYGYGPAFGLNIHINGGHPAIYRGPFPHQHATVRPPYPRPYVGRPYSGARSGAPAPARHR